MATGSDYLPVATEPTANVDSQSNFSGSGYQENGFQIGVALPQQANKIWRQASMVAACITNFIANQLGIYVSDDGNLTNLISNFVAALKSLINGIRHSINIVPYSATPTFDLSLADVQQMTLTGNVTSATFENYVPGQVFWLVLFQDSTGGRTFSNGFNGAGAISPTPNSCNIQAFLVTGGGFIMAVTPISFDF